MIKHYFEYNKWDSNKYMSVRSDIAADNLAQLKITSFFATAAFLVMSLVSLSNTIIHKNLTMYAIYGVVSLFIFCTTLVIKPEHEKLITVLLYAFKFLLLSFGIVLGTLIMPENATVNYIAIMLAVPLFYVTRPLYTNLTTLVSIVIYVIAAYFTQSPAMFEFNLLNVAPYGILSLLISDYSMGVKLQRYLYKNETLSTKRQVNNYEKIITEMIRQSSSEDDAGMILNNLLKFMGENAKSDRAYIFEINKNNNYDNTYEWCKEGVAPEIDNLQDVPGEVINPTWIKMFKHSHNIVISDIEEYKKISKEVYDILKPQNINTLVAGPITIDGKIVGFYGVDNPPIDHLQYLSELFKLIEFIFSTMIRLRNNAIAIEESALKDQLTGCKNRKALAWAYDGKYDKEKPFTVILCDLNGLKEVNDKQGHEAGDHFICRSADIYCEVFGHENVYRMGGDEFAIVLPEKNKQEVDELMRVCRLQIGTTATMGMAHRERMDISMEKIFHDADMEMYRLKEEYYKTRPRYR